MNQETKTKITKVHIFQKITELMEKGIKNRMLPSHTAYNSLSMMLDLIIDRQVADKIKQYKLIARIKGDEYV